MCPASLEENYKHTEAATLPCARTALRHMRNSTWAACVGPRQCVDRAMSRQSPRKQCGTPFVQTRAGRFSRDLQECAKVQFVLILILNNWSDKSRPTPEFYAQQWSDYSGSSQTSHKGYNSILYWASASQMDYSSTKKRFCFAIIIAVDSSTKRLSGPSLKSHFGSKLQFKRPVLQHRKKTSFSFSRSILNQLLVWWEQGKFFCKKQSPIFHIWSNNSKGKCLKECLVCVSDVLPLFLLCTPGTKKHVPIFQRVFGQHAVFMTHSSGPCTFKP